MLITKMRITIIFFLILISNIAFAQCPSLSFSADSILCAGDTLIITNTSSGGQSYSWDFCLGDIENGLDTSFKGNFSPALNNSYGNQLIFENGLFYGFCISPSGNLVRLDFGNSMSNAPVLFSIGSLGFLNNTYDLKLIKSDTLWFAYFTSTNDKLYKVSFGSNIANNTPIASELILTGGNLSFPLSMELKYDGTNYFVAFSNFLSNQISLVNLGSNLTSDSAVVSNINVSIAPVGVDIVNDCGQWYVFTGGISSGTILRLDFGNSLLNSPTITSYFPAGSGAGGIRDLQIIHDANWYIITVDNNGTLMQRINLGKSLTATNVNAVSFFTNPGPYNTLEFLKVNSKWYSLQTNFSNGDLNVMEFINNCSANILTDSNYIPSDIIYSSSGYQYYSLDSYDSLANFNTLVDSVQINPSPTALFNTSGSCTNTSISFFDSSSINNGVISNWLWNFGDGSNDSIQNPTHIYTISGTYPVSLTATSLIGCSSKYHDTLFVNDRPIANFTFVDNQCLSKEILFTDSTVTTIGIPSYWDWDFGDGTKSNDQNPLHSYNAPGTYDVQLISAVVFGCNDTVIKQITIIPAPEPNFTVLFTCIGDTSFFINTTSIQGGILTNYFWNFGDGDTSINIDPIHSYTPTINTYNVQLIAYSSNGCSDTLNKDLKINTRPQPGFEMSDTIVCVGESVTFNDTSLVIGDTIIATLWNFGDSSTDTNRTTAHTYFLPGIYNVTLTSFSPTSCDSSITKVITVIDKPSASYTYNQVCEGDTVFFNNSSVAAGGSFITSVNWSFGDTNSDTLFSTSHLYNGFGLFNVSLVVTDNKGCYDSIGQVINVFDKPQADFALSSTCSDIDIQFTDASIINGDTIQQWFWDFGDLSVSNLKNPIHSYSSPGTYSIELIVVSSQGCSDTITKSFNLKQTPLATFNFAQTCDGNPVPFTYLPVVFPSPVTNWFWEFGDAGTSTIVNPAHIYASPGTYNVSLTVSDTINNCSSTITKTVSVDPIPNINFGWTGNCENESILFLDSSNISTGVLINWDWDFGDSISGTGQTAFHTYNTPGTYAIKLVVESLRGCSDSLMQSITINEKPIANYLFNPPYGSAPLLVNFTNTSSGANGFTWNFGDSTALSSDINPNHLFQSSGIFEVILLAENSFGCTDSINQSINIFNPRNDIAIQNVFTELNGSSLTIKALLLNVGNIPISSVTLEAQAESYGIISEIWTGNLQPNSPQELFTFSAQLKIDEFNPPKFVCVEAIKPNELSDFNISNNKFCIVIDNEIQFIDPFPNPFNDEITLGINLPESDLLIIHILNINGSLVKELYNSVADKGFTFLTLNTSIISDGYYLMKVEYLGKDYYFPVIKN